MNPTGYPRLRSLNDTNLFVFIPFLFGLILMISTPSGVSSTIDESDETFTPHPTLPMSEASVESLVSYAGWNYVIDEEGDLRLLFHGEDDHPDHAVFIIMERTPSERVWGISFIHPIGTVPADRANRELESLLRAANEFNRTRAFGKIFLDPNADGSWSIRLMHTFDFADGISAANFLDPLIMMMQEMASLYDRFFLEFPENAGDE
jgi:hypothetical protein